LTEDTERPAEGRTIDKEVRSDFRAEGNVVKGTRTEKATIQEPAPDKEDMPLPTDPRTIFLGGLFMLAMLVVLYVAAEIIIPIVLAVVLKLILQPLVRVLEHVHVPRGAGAIVAILLLLAVLGGTISALAAPATSWASKLPDAIPQVRDNLEFMKRPIATIQSVLHQVEGIAGNEPAGEQAGAAPVKGPNLLGTLLGGTASVTASFLTTLLVLFYLLVSGETFMRRLVEILPRFRDKRQAVELSMHVERDISAYLLTVTLINVIVGIATGLVMWLCGVANPALWGAVAFVLNFVPILGPMMGIIIFLMASVLALGVSWWALLPVGLYLGIHVLEGEILTPMILARRFTINPVAVILSLIFWYWMWGVVGAILAVPMLAIIKIVCDDLRPLRAIGHFLEG
jgi:predicted PurR-regulated permease PerM